MIVMIAGEELLITREPEVLGVLPPPLSGPYRATVDAAWALEAAGMREVPQGFSVVPQHQLIPAATLREIEHFIHIFDQVTSREAWRAATQREAPSIAQLQRREICFFNAWDFHLPPQGGSQLIEFNDNGSGFLFAAIVNALYYEMIKLSEDKFIARPADFLTFTHNVINMMEQEANAQRRVHRFA